MRKTIFQFFYICTSNNEKENEKKDCLVLKIIYFLFFHYIKLQDMSSVNPNSSCFEIYLCLQLIHCSTGLHVFQLQKKINDFY